MAPFICGLIHFLIINALQLQLYSRKFRRHPAQCKVTTRLWMTLPRSPLGRWGGVGVCLEAGLRATPSPLALVLDLFLGYWFNVCCAVHQRQECPKMFVPNKHSPVHLLNRSMERDFIDYIHVKKWTNCWRMRNVQRKNLLDEAMSSGPAHVGGHLFVLRRDTWTSLIWTKPSLLTLKSGTPFVYTAAAPACWLRNRSVCVKPGHGWRGESPLVIEDTWSAALDSDGSHLTAVCASTSRCVRCRAVPPLPSRPAGRARAWKWCLPGTLS